MLTIKDPVRKALLISLLASVLSLSLKFWAFWVTDATGALADSAESAVHLIAVLFVVYGYYLSRKPADDEHPYGHERIEFLSVGVEGTVIVIAGITIIYHGISNAITGIEIQNMATGIYLLSASALINLVTGLYVLKTGRKAQNAIAISNGKHTLTDVWTSGGVVLSLLIISITGWMFVDLIISFIIAFFIMWEAQKLLRFAIKGIMDERNPDIDECIRKTLNEHVPKSLRSWHHLRHRTIGSTTWVELHGVFDEEISLRDAHDKATKIEHDIIHALETDAVVTLHLEPDDDHDDAHKILKGANKAKGLDEFS